MIIVIAPAYGWVEVWCREQHYQGKQVLRGTIVTFTSQKDFFNKSKGRHKQEGDRLVYLGLPQGVPWSLLRAIFIPCGFSEMEDEDGRMLPL